MFITLGKNYLNKSSLNSVRDWSLLSSYIKHLIKWTVTVGGIILIVNMIGLAAYLSINQELVWAAFMRLLLTYSMLEGLMIMLVGCAALFGFKKYIEWPAEEARRSSKRDRNSGSGRATGSGKSLGVFFVALGMLLFLPSFIVFSFLF
jgi:hypothetical protein